MSPVSPVDPVVYRRHMYYLPVHRTGDPSEALAAPEMAGMELRPWLSKSSINARGCREPHCELKTAPKFPPAVEKRWVDLVAK